MGAGCCCCKKDTRTLSPYHPTSQLTEIGIRTRDPLLAINGYLNEPQLSLEEALQPVNESIDQLSHYINEAKAKCYYPSKHNLNQDESAALYIYSMQWPGRCVRNQLQGAWNSNDRSTMEPWFKYLKLLNSALNKLPSVKSEIWQGSLYDERLKEQLNSKTLSFYTSLCSCSSSVNDITKHLQQRVGNNVIVIAYQYVNGKSVTGYTANDWEEAIVWPGIKLEVSKYVATETYYAWIMHGVTQSKQLIHGSSLKSGKHFKCPYKGCPNRCSGNHKSENCRASAGLSHECQHYCTPWKNCDECGRADSHISRCFKCDGYYCDRCCYQ